MANLLDGMSKSFNAVASGDTTMVAAVLSKALRSVLRLRLL